MTGHLPATLSSGIRSMSQADIQRVRRLEASLLDNPQVDVTTHHIIHAGMYLRTIRVPEGVVMTGAEIKRATALIISGHVLMTIGDETVELLGYHAIPASAGRKQAFYAKADTDMTMVFATDAKTVEEAESQFTNESEQLLSRKGENIVVITGE